MGGCPLSRPGARTLGPAWRLVVTALLLATPAPCVGRTGARRATSFGSHKTANPVGQRRYQYIYEYRSTPWGGWLEHGICALGDSTRPATFVGSGGTNRLLISRGLRWRRFRGRGARLARLASCAQSTLWSGVRPQTRAARSVPHPRASSRPRGDHRAWHRGPRSAQ